MRRYEPLTTPPSSRGRGTALGCRLVGSRASRRCSTCCAPSGWCRRGGTARSAPSGSGSPGCRTSADSAPSRRKSTCGETGRDWQRTKRWMKRWEPTGRKNADDATKQNFPRKFTSLHHGSFKHCLLTLKGEAHFSSHIFSSQKLY